MEFVGLFGGMALAIVGWYVGRVMAKKNHGLDEVNEYIWRKARSVSWYCTLAAIYVLMILGAFEFEIGLFPALGILLLVQLTSWALTGAWFMVKLTEGDHTESSKALPMLAMIIGLVLLICLGIISVFTRNWNFILLGFFSIWFMVIMTYTQSRLRKKQDQTRD
jgi:uncharacterized membrane protein YvlD (DUF360 family)